MTVQYMGKQYELHGDVTSKVVQEGMGVEFFAPGVDESGLTVTLVWSMSASSPGYKDFSNADRIEGR